jgi:hypothetical protein
MEEGSDSLWELIRLHKAATNFFNTGLEAYKKAQYQSSITDLQKSRQTFQKFNQLFATKPPKTSSIKNVAAFNKNVASVKVGLIRSSEMYGRSLEKTNQYELALRIFAETIMWSDFEEWAEKRRNLYKETHEEFHKHDATQPVSMEDLMYRYARCKYFIRKSENPPKLFCLYQMLQQAQKTNPNDSKFSSTNSWDMVLEEELRAMEQVEMEQGDKHALIEEKFTLLKWLLTLNTKDSHPIRYAMFYRKYAVLLLVKEYSAASLNRSILMLDTCIDLLNSNVDTDRKDGYMENVVKAELGLALATRGLYKAQLALIKFQESAKKVDPPITTNLSVDKLCSKIQSLLVKHTFPYDDIFDSAITDIRNSFDQWNSLLDMIVVNMEDMYDVLDDTASIVDYFGLTSLYVASLG